MPATGPQGLVTMAWLSRGISTIPGYLGLRPDRHVFFLAFGSGTAWGFQLRKMARRSGKPDYSDELLNGDDPAVMIFEERLQDVKIWFPWHYFMGGLKVRTSHDLYRFSFGPPVNRSQWVDALSYISPMRATAREWRARLAEAAASQHESA